MKTSLLQTEAIAQFYILFQIQVLPLKLWIIAYSCITKRLGQASEAQLYVYYSWISLTKPFLLLQETSFNISSDLWCPSRLHPWSHCVFNPSWLVKLKTFLPDFKTLMPQNLLKFNNDKSEVLLSTHGVNLVCLLLSKCYIDKVNQYFQYYLVCRLHA